MKCVAGTALTLIYQGWRLAVCPGSTEGLTQSALLSKLGAPSCRLRGERNNDNCSINIVWNTCAFPGSKRGNQYWHSVKPTFFSPFFFCHASETLYFSWFQLSKSWSPLISSRQIHQRVVSSSVLGIYTWKEWLTQMSVSLHWACYQLRQDSYIQWGESQLTVPLILRSVVTGKNRACYDQVFVHHCEVHYRLCLGEMRQKTYVQSLNSAPWWSRAFVESVTWTVWHIENIWCCFREDLNALSY